MTTNASKSPMFTLDERLAMVRREVELGTVLPVRWDGGEASATVVALPF